MPVSLEWSDIAWRLALTAAAGCLFGLERGEHGRAAGMRTMLLVGLAACLAMVLANLLLPTAGRRPDSFVTFDVMRLPLGILSGIGFIGAGVIVKRDNNLVSGVTTAATIWFVSVLGLLFGGGQLVLGCAATALAIFILWGLRYAENFIPRVQQGHLLMALDARAPVEEELRNNILKAGCEFTRWQATYEPPGALAAIECTIRWRERPSHQPHTPAAIEQLRVLPGVRSLTWSE